MYRCGCSRPTVRIPYTTRTYNTCLRPTIILYYYIVVDLQQKLYNNSEPEIVHIIWLEGIALYLLTLLSSWYNKISHSPTLYLFCCTRKIRVLKLNAISCYANSTFVPAQQISPLSLVLFSFCCTRNPNFQIICTLSNGMLCYRSNMCDFSTTKLNRSCT